MPNESQSGGELPTGATAVTIRDDVSVVIQFQPLQQVVHQLEGEKKQEKKTETIFFNFPVATL